MPRTAAPIKGLYIKGRNTKQLGEIDPNHQDLIDAFEMGPDATFFDLHNYLWITRANFEYHPGSPAVGRSPAEPAVLLPNGDTTKWLLHTYPISYDDSKDKANWSKTPGLEKYGCFSDFFKEPLDWQTWRIGFFTTKTGNWVANRDWRKLAWHCWAAVWIPAGAPKDKMGCRLCIWDINAYENYTGKTSLTLNEIDTSQRKFIAFVQKRHTINDVYILKAIGPNDEGLCVPYTCEWIKFFVQQNMLPSDEALQNLDYAVRVRLDRGGQPAATPAATRKGRRAMPPRSQPPFTRSRASSAGPSFLPSKPNGTRKEPMYAKRL